MTNEGINYCLSFPNIIEGWSTWAHQEMTPKERVSAIQALTEALKYMLSNEEKQVLIDKIVQLTKGL